MLDAIGVASIDDLFADVPEALRLGRPLDLPDGKPEQEVYGYLRDLAARNVSAEDEVSFLGAGMYDHYVPALVDSIVGALGVPDAVHAVPARGLPGRPAGDVRVPDDDLGAHRPARLQRERLRGPERAGRRRLPGQAAHGPHALRRLARRAPALARDAGHHLRRLGDDGRRGRARRRRHGRRRRSRPRSATTSPPCSWRQPNFLGAVEDLEALAPVAKATGALLSSRWTR